MHLKNLFVNLQIFYYLCIALYNNKYRIIIMIDASIIIFVIVVVAIIVWIILAIRFEREKQEIISTVTTLSRGESSEQDLIYRLVKAGIPAKTIFHDLYIKTKRGYTQIDIVVPTDKGIFVFEVKDYSGWLFGNGKYAKWTQVLAYGQERHQFYNPIMQNARHIEALRNTSEQLQNIPIYSIIVFYGSCEIKDLTNVPSDCWVVYDYDAVRIVKNIMETAHSAPYTDKWEVMRILKSGVENGDDETIKAAHIDNVQRASYGKYNSTYSYSYFNFPRFKTYRRRRFRF